MSKYLWVPTTSGALFRVGEHVESRNSGRHGIVKKVVVPGQVYLVKWQGKRGPAMQMDEGDLYHLRRVGPKAR